MTTNATVVRRAQIGRETTRGTAVAAATRFPSLSFAPKPMLDTQEIRTTGYIPATKRVTNYEQTDFEVSGIPTYEELTYLFGNFFKTVTSPTSLGGSPAAYQWTFTPSASTPETTDSWTVETGSPLTRAERFTGAVLAALKMGFKRRGGNTVSGTGFGQRTSFGIQMSTNEQQSVTLTGGPSGGTFTLTYSGQTTANIAYNAAASAVQSALEALSNIEVGDVSVSGSAGGPWTVEFRGNLGTQNVAAMTASGTGLTPSGGVTIATPVPGVAPTEVAQTPIAGAHVDLYFDTSFAGIGVTQLTAGFNLEADFSGRYSPKVVLDSSKTSWGDITAGPVDAKLSLTIEADATAEAMLTTYARANTTAFMRLQATGPLISGSNYNRLRLDMPVQVANGGDRSDEDGVYAHKYDLTIVRDSTFTSAGWITADLINTLSAL